MINHCFANHALIDTQGMATAYRLVRTTIVEVRTFSANYESRFSGIASPPLLPYHYFMSIGNLDALFDLYVVGGR